MSLQARLVGESTNLLVLWVLVIDCSIGVYGTIGVHEEGVRFTSPSFGESWVQVGLSYCNSQGGNTHTSDCSEENGEWRIEILQAHYPAHTAT